MIELISNNLRIFRDDIFPSIGGGNKGRKMEYIGKYILQNNFDCMVTTGGIQSNHCRAVALFAAQNKLECTLVIHGDKHKFNNDSGNAKIIRLSGAKIIFAEQSSDIGGLMDQAMINFKNLKKNPYYIWGGGHTMEGGLAYVEAIKVLNEYSLSHNWKPEYIFLASGTGSTQAGIMAGLDKYNFDQTRVVGISIGRKSLQAESVVKDFYNKLCSTYNIKNGSRSTIVLDKYLCGGYDKSNQELDHLSLNSVKNYGFTLDTTYTGKAFYGMQQYIKSNHLQGNFLFWHTGGIFNFLAE